jgi:hypothetical protein
VKSPAEILAEGRAAREKEIVKWVNYYQQKIIDQLKIQPDLQQLSFYEIFEERYREEIYAALRVAGFKLEIVTPKKRWFADNRPYLLISGWVCEAETPNTEKHPHREPPAHCPTCGALQEGAKS